jgi:hypothetical protein
LIQIGLPYDAVGEGTWLIQTETAHPAQIAVTVDEPIVLFAISMFDIADDVTDREQLFRTLLELNRELLHSSYALEGEAVVLSGAQQVENLDFNEFQAMIDDMSMALDKHWDKLAPWGLRGKESA